MDGILNINKPPGMTSFQVVAAVRRIASEKHAGHAGTLDPLAMGVLPVCLGQATRIIEYLFNETKVYRAVIELGITTDTYDAAGKIMRQADFQNVSREMVETALKGFAGTIEQTPPMFSALKHKGQPLYKLARSGVEVVRESRPVQIHSLEILSWNPPYCELEVVCGKGTYIRSLANDLGEVLGCGAYLKNLVRRRVGPFDIEDALSLERLQNVFSSGQEQGVLYPLDFALSDYTAVVVTREQQCSLIHGAPIGLETEAGRHAFPDAGAVVSRAYNAAGDFLGMIKYDAEASLWRPEKIFMKNCCEGSALSTIDTKNKGE